MYKVLWDIPASDSKIKMIDTDAVCSNAQYTRGRIDLNLHLNFDDQFSQHLSTGGKHE